MSRILSEKEIEEVAKRAVQIASAAIRQERQGSEKLEGLLYHMTTTDGGAQKVAIAGDLFTSYIYKSLYDARANS